MNSTKLMRRKYLILPILLLLMFCIANNVAARDASGAADTWQYDLAIYGWLPDIKGDLKYGVPPADGGGRVTVDASDIIDALNFVFMGTFQAHYNKLSFATDIIYMDLSDSKGTTINLGPEPGVPVNVAAKLSLTSWVVTGIVGYDVVQTDRAGLALVGGLRYLNLDSDLGLSASGPNITPPPAYLSESDNIWDGIVGVKGSFMLGKNWYLPYYADIGAGDSQLTWQLFAGIGYMFHWGDIVLAYRYLNYDQDDDKFIQDLALYGPLLGVNFRF